jgi:8-amino-7-oxononanoate synthase
MPGWIDEELRRVEARSELRALTTWPAPGPYLERGGRRYVNLASNDYLGLTADSMVREAAARAARDLGTGATASRLLAGSCRLHDDLEAALAAWKGHPSALLFSSGYMAAQGVIPVVVGRGDWIVADRLSHASLLDAARLSGAKLVRFRHNDVADAARHVAARAKDQRCLLVTESVFSMNGDLAPVTELLELARESDALLLVDEAHAIGVCGPRAAGQTADRPEADDALIALGTLGKSLASAGGFVTCSRRLRQLLMNRARTFLFDTALPPPTLAAALAAVGRIESHPEWRDQLEAKSTRLREHLEAAGLDTMGSRSAILPVGIGDNARAVACAARLEAAGILVAAIRPPTVPPGTARLRLSVSLAHSDDDLATVARAIIDIVGTTP